MACNGAQPCLALRLGNKAVTQPGTSDRCSQAMKRDTKLNSMLLPVSKLKLMLESYRTHGRGSGVDFRVPHKRLW